MKYNELGHTGIKVSNLCLGTMTWGTQNTPEEAFNQMDRSLEAGINFVDTAEMYPVNPIGADTQGDAERILGQWVAKSNRRDDVVIATKVAGEGLGHIRGGAKISRETITAAVEVSLKSLQTDYIDLYQLHWPNRGSYHFRQNWHFNPVKQDKYEFLDHIEEVLETCSELEEAGKIRAFGLSNESAWGTAQWLRKSDEMNLPRMATMQNEYSLMCRLYDLDMAEMSHNENVGLLAFSPLAAGLLSGKYLDGACPEGSRGSIVSGLGGRIAPRVDKAVQAYIDVAAKHDLHPCQMALAWCQTKPFMTSAIFGARLPEQLDVVISSIDLELTADCLRDIDRAHKENPMPY